MTDMFKELLDLTDNEFASIMEDDTLTDINRFIDTGSYSLNALFSGTIYGGIAGNRSTAFAGEPSTGKTFFTLSTCKRFLDENPDGYVFYFETEFAVSRQMVSDRGINLKRFANMPVSTVQDFRSQCLRILNRYLETKPKDRKPMLLCLDSLGNLSTSKEMEDIAEGKDTRDMTRAQLIKGAFRVLQLKLGLAGIPLICTNHVYDVIGPYVPLKKMGGGSGLEYAASQIIFLGKKKDSEKEKDARGKDVTVTHGVIIKATLKKSRLTIENKSVNTFLDYETGLDRYYGLTDLALKFGIWKKLSTKIMLNENEGVTEKEIDNKPEKYFTKEILDKIDAACKDEFLYGKTAFTDEKEKE